MFIQVETVELKNGHKVQLRIDTSKDLTIESVLWIGVLRVLTKQLGVKQALPWLLRIDKSDP